ncbi:hypothetical protein [Kitasatospora aureofaciens]|uniref:hypothetical protein n=1 Tax=Kitasatospora aureofaciens TaxID=1894 RepID=UPI001C48CC98|nr:hypothetical protein [Kitasatospora aureofaciens]MBV6696062.1 hypothetical protein [Kitasatospora aureofaciens]
MNLRALTRGDAAVAGAAVLLFIASFLPYWTYSSSCVGAYCGASVSNSQNAWSTELFPILPSIYLLGIAAAVLILLQRFQGPAVANRQVLGLRLDQWGIAFAVAALWTSIWSLGGGPSGTNFGHGFGAWLGLISLVVLAGAAAAGPLVPALKAPLVTDRPAVPYQGGYPMPGQPGQPGAPGQPGQYGYPVPGQDPNQAPGYGAQPGGYGYPAPGAPGQPGPHDITPAAAPQPMPAPAPAADFAPFWFAVPSPRPLAPKDNPVGAPIGELVPGTWYLAVEQRGTALVAQLQDGTQGVLADTTGIQRG